MIIHAYVIRHTGDIVYTKSYTKDETPSSEKLPDFVDTIITLYSSSESTRMGQAYFHARDNKVWAYVFFEHFVIVLLTTDDEDITSTKRRLISLGRAIANENIEKDSIADLEEIVDRYVELDITVITDSLLAVMELLIYSALEKYDISYAGVFGAQGRLIKGNVPENHVRKIKAHLSIDSLKPSVDLVPSTLLISGHEVQMLKVQYLTVVAAPYRDSSKLPATRAVGEMAETLRDAIMKLNTSSK